LVCSFAAASNDIISMAMPAAMSISRPISSSGIFPINHIGSGVRQLNTLAVG